MNASLADLAAAIVDEAEPADTEAAVTRIRRTLAEHGAREITAQSDPDVHAALLAEVTTGIVMAQLGDVARCQVEPLRCMSEGRLLDGDAVRLELDSGIALLAALWQAPEYAAVSRTGVSWECAAALIDESARVFLTGTEPVALAMTVRALEIAATQAGQR